jgi:glycosyltransferase-like protein
MTSVALLTYSTKPRGGVIHTLALAEALVRQNVDVEIIAMGDPSVGFFRSVAAPSSFVPNPEWHGGTLDDKVFATVDAFADGLRTRSSSLPPILHVQDCISARAAMRLRDEGLPVQVLRTVHHVDDFTTRALIECQNRSIYDPDRLLVVSRMWQQKLAADFGVTSGVVTNGVDIERFAPRPPQEVLDHLRTQVGADGRFLILSIGGIEPRKGSDHLFRSLAKLRDKLGHRPMLAIIGGHSFQDHRPYRDAVIATMPSLDLEFGRDVVELGTLPDDQMVRWYHAADALAFPSVNEGWGLVVLEAMAAGTPTVVCDLPVFREYLTPGRDALVVQPGDDEALADALASLATDEPLRRRLINAGDLVAAHYSWDDTATAHRSIYREMLRTSTTRSDERLPQVG